LAWRLVTEKRAEKELDALDQITKERILRALAQLVVDPYRVANVKALYGGLYRLRVGDYRIVYGLRDKELVIVLVRVAHRREVYRRR
jgi:mRNA interferase RelE/StbE